ncbi:MAG: hypothetical protein LUD57_02095 [Ruminococcus sp.]|nr:hypothetical protein [Ruminococcus sp.]MCD8187407.1 hypothetical protein [Ruminococcus sp.]
MKELINGYIRGCNMLKERIDELTQTMNELRKNGGEDKIEELNLEQRIRLLYTEHRQAQETIEYLTAYMRRVEERGTKRNIL